MEEEGKNENGKRISARSKLGEGGEREERWSALSLCIPEPCTASIATCRKIHLLPPTAYNIYELSQQVRPIPHASTPDTHP